jgi:translocation and assembly module TamB
MDALDVKVGSASLKGALTLDDKGLATGHIAFAGPRLDDLAPLALTRLSGTLDADIALAASSGEQSAKVTLRGSQVKAAGAAIADIDLTAAIADLYGRPRVDADLAIDRAVFAGQSFTRIRAQSRSGPAGDDITASAAALGFDVSARARLLAGEPMRVELASFEARRGGRNLKLVQPATFTLAKDGIDIAKLALAIESGRLTVDGRAGRTLDLRIGAKAVPLAAARIFAPSLAIAGTLDASATIAGTPAAPSGQYQLSVSRLSLPRMAEAGVPPLDVRASGRLEGGRATTDATASIGRFGSVRVRGAVPLGAEGALDLAADGRLDLAITNAVLGPAGRRLAGTAAIDVQVKGTPTKPRLGGSLNVSGGSFDDFLMGVRLTALRLRATARGDRVTVDEMRAATPNGGAISASGEVRVDPAAGFPGTIRIDGRRATLASTSFLTLVADLGLTLSGPLAQDPRVTGTVTVRSMDVSIAERLPASLRPIQDVRHLHAPRQVAARLAAQRKAAAARARRAGAFNATLDIAMRAPGESISVHGRGLAATLGGELAITGTLAKPVPVGAFVLRRGDLNIIGNNLDIRRGRVSFSGDFMPDIDFLAEARATDITAQIGVTGTAAAPVFTFSSQPELPQDEILSRILFAKASGSLTAFQAIQLAEAASEFSNGSGPFERLRKSLGLGGGKGGLLGALPPSVSKRIHVGVQTGATPAESGLTIDFDVTRHVRVRGEADANGATAIGIGTEYEY